MIINHDEKTITIEVAIDLIPAENYIKNVVPIEERKKWRFKEPEETKMINVSSSAFKRLYEPGKCQRMDVSKTNQK